MTGAEINNRLERGPLGKYPIRELAIRPSLMELQAPSDSDYTNGMVDSVTAQIHRIDAQWDADKRRLVLSRDSGGHGYWIPYLGNGSQRPHGMAHTMRRGLGTYTPVIATGGPISWVVTGPFSGCYSAVFSPNGGKVFAHIITPAAGYTADTTTSQAANIAQQVGSHLPPDRALQKVTGGPGEGFVFWTLVNGVWYQRVVWAWPVMIDRAVKGVDPKRIV